MYQFQSAGSFKRLAITLAVPALFVLAACGADAQQLERQAHRAERSERAATRLTEQLDLNASQSELVTTTLSEARQPGALWTLAAELEPTLSDEQKAMLFTRPERAERGERPGPGERPQRGERPERRNGARQQAAGDDRRMAGQQARNTALGLSAEQIARLDQIQEQHQSEREQAREERMERMRQNRAERPGPGQLPSDITSVLTDNQQDVMKVYLALRGRVHGPRGGRGMRGGRGPRGIGDGGPPRGQ